MINIAVGLLEIIDDEDGPYINVRWDIKDESAPHDCEPYIAISGVGTRPFHTASPFWSRLVDAIKEGGREGNIQLKNVINIINTLPIDDDWPAEWLQFWANKASVELGDKAYMYYS